MSRPSPDVVTPDQPATSPRPARKVVTMEKVLVSAGVALGLVLVIVGLNLATTGRDALGYPDAIVDISPAPNDRQVLSQTEIVVDLADGYEAILYLDDIELPVTRLEDVAGGLVEPGTQIELPPTAIYDEGNSLIRIEPRQGAPVERYRVGLHQAKVLFWKIDEGRSSARSYSWSFEVL